MPLSTGASVASSASTPSSPTASIIPVSYTHLFTPITDGYLQDRFCESLLKTVIHYAPIAMEQPDNYEARANLMWASSWGINDMIGYGKRCAWTVHPMEHELSAFFDITHGVGLAILTPTWKMCIRDRVKGTLKNSMVSPRYVISNSEEEVLLPKKMEMSGPLKMCIRDRFTAICFIMPFILYQPYRPPANACIA